MCIYVCIYVCMYVCTVRIYIYTHIYIYVLCAYIYTHIYIHHQLRWVWQPQAKGLAEVGIFFWWPWNNKESSSNLCCLATIIHLYIYSVALVALLYRGPTQNSDRWTIRSGEDQESREKGMMSYCQHNDGHRHMYLYMGIISKIVLFIFPRRSGPTKSQLLGFRSCPLGGLSDCSCESHWALFVWWHEGKQQIIPRFATHG